MSVSAALVALMAGRVTTGQMTYDRGEVLISDRIVPDAWSAWSLLNRSGFGTRGIVNPGGSQRVQRKWARRRASGICRRKMS